jgi:Holin of 3TMs, for gene-transfer release
MANEDEIATGHNVKGDEEWLPNPNKVKPKPAAAPVAAAPSYIAPVPPAAAPPIQPVAVPVQPVAAPVQPIAAVADTIPVAPPPPVQETVVVVAPQPQAAQQNYVIGQQTAQVQAQASVGLAQTSIDQEIAEDQIAKQNEHWMKSYWRPAMGWLYMIICFMDFVGFPLLTIFLPIIFKPFGLTMPYTAWQSLTLSNGGLIHLSFGAILGVSAWTRGQEKKL